MKRLLSFILPFTFALSLGGGAVSAKSCHDAKGKFTKCPPTAMTTMKKKPCRDAKGRFTKCHDTMMKSKM